MIEFIPYQMSEDNCINICRENVMVESEDQIKRENEKSYHQAYTVISLC